jgi:DNA-binding PadR family transcriptional regulator
MNKPTTLPAALSVQEFYTLFALYIREGHAYNLRSRVIDMSLGSVIIAGGTLYPLLTRLHAQGYIAMLGDKPVGLSGTPRRHYGITPAGTIRLKEEITRMRHAVKIAEHNHLLDDEIPLDIQKLLIELA